VRNNIMGTDIVSGCTLAGVSCSNNL